jgi:glucokinase
MILAGDVGGTNARLAIYDVEHGKPTPLALEVVPTRLYGSFREVAAGFMERHATPVERACFGVPGPVKGGRADPPNLAWEFDEERLADELGLEKVHLVNDLVANAYGIAALEEEDFALLNAGEPLEGGNRALISPGTGLGEAGLLWLGGNHRPFPSEGGHTDFAPRDELEIALLQFLLTRLEHVSYETILSGSGLHRIYQFLRETGRAEEPAWLADRIQAEDPPAVISTVALEGGSELCVRALDLFVSILGAEAGNLALKVFATGGVFIGGGIAPKILPKLKEPAFVKSFTTKGKMKALVRSIPVHAILNDKTVLLGAARYAGLQGAQPE